MHLLAGVAAREADGVGCHSLAPPCVVRRLENTVALAVGNRNTRVNPDPHRQPPFHVICFYCHVLNVISNTPYLKQHCPSFPFLKPLLIFFFKLLKIPEIIIIFYYSSVKKWVAYYNRNQCNYNYITFIKML